MSTAAELGQRADEAFTKLEGLTADLEAARGGEQDRFNSLKAEVETVASDVASFKQAQADAEAKEAQEATITELKAQMDALRADMRSPSKAKAVLSEIIDASSSDADSFFRTLAIAQNPKAPTSVRAEAEKALADMGSTWQGVPADSKGSLKATLGATDAGGGYLAPRAVVADFTTVGVATNPYRSLLTVVTGIPGPTVEIPHIGLAPQRATVQARGATKTNVSLDFANYTATFYTLALIYDAANQWLRQTGGQGEKIIRTRLGQSIALGESYYILNGSGTSEPKGILTSIGTSGTFVTSHTASNSTIAGNAATAIAKASGAIAGRNRTPTGVVMNSSDFWIFMAQGADAAGFYIAPTGGAASVNAVGAFDNGSPAMRIWGLPVFADPNMPADSLVVGAWKEAELYIGADYRVDTSTEAGTRWDQNLTGFRGEEDMAFNADPYVVSGMFQRIIDAVA